MTPSSELSSPLGWLAGSLFGIPNFVFVGLIAGALIVLVIRRGGKVKKTAISDRPTTNEHIKDASQYSPDFDPSLFDNGHDENKATTEQKIQTPSGVSLSVLDAQRMNAAFVDYFIAGLKNSEKAVYLDGTHIPIKRKNGLVQLDFDDADLGELVIRVPIKESQNSNQVAPMPQKKIAEPPEIEE